MPKIVITAPMGGKLTESLRAEFPAVTFTLAPDLESQLKELPDADATISWPHREALPVAKKLRWVQCTSAGIERIRGIPELIEMDQVVLTNARGSNTPAIGDHFFALLLALTRHVPDIMEDNKARRWDRPGRAKDARELTGAVLGLLGLGTMGANIAKRAIGFDMQLRGVDLNPAARCPGVSEVWGLDRLDDLLRVSDYVAVCLPFTPQTRGLIGAREIGLMKPEAALFVMSRGGIVDESALADAIKNGRLWGAALDSTQPEPPPPDHPLWGLPNVILSPHCSFSSRQTEERRDAILRENIRRFVAGEPLTNLCDKRAGY